LLILLPLVAGYTLSVTLNASLYYAARESGHRLYFRALFYAVFLVITATLIHIILGTKSDTYHSHWMHLLNDIADGRGNHGIWGVGAGISIALISIVIVLPIQYIANLDWLRHTPWTDAYRARMKDYLLKKAIEHNDFERLLHRSFERKIPIMFTLDNGKVYVGTLVRAPNPIEQRRAIRITPFLSGHRDKKTQKFTVTTFYGEILELLNKNPSERPEALKHLEQEDMEIIIPSDMICSSHLFDLGTYLDHFDKDGFGNT